MTSYGFKLFKAQLVRRDGRTPLPWTHLNSDGTATYEIDELEALFNSYKSVTERGLPLGPDARTLSAHERRIRPVFQVEDVSRHGSGLLLSIRYGRHRDEDRGLPASEAATGEVDLTEIAPTRAYRVAVLPPSTGNVGVLAVEHVAGACPSKFFVKWARKWAMDDAGTSSDWKKLWAHAAVDPALLERFLRVGSADKVYLVQRINTSARGRAGERFRIEAAVWSSQADAIMQRVGQAIVSEASEEESDARFASDLADILGTDLGELDVNDGWAVIDTPSGPQTVSPSRVPEIFVYPIGSTRPSDLEFRRAVKPEAVRIAPSLGATLDWAGW